jgi:hypothetical protein
MTHMRIDDDAENRLRELFRDPRWSLPSWPDAEARVRNAARRQRLRAARVSAVAGIAAVAALTAVVVPVLPGVFPPRTVQASIPNVLTCHDSAGQQPEDGPPARLVNGVDGFIGDRNAYDTLPVQHLQGSRYLALKTALSVAPDAGPYRTVTVVTPASARLSYGSSILKASRSVRLPACGRRYALYVGGILVRHPACVTITVTGPDGESDTVSVPVLRSCPEHSAKRPATTGAPS